MTRRIYTVIICAILSFALSDILAQSNEEFLGAGNDQGIRVRASSSLNMTRPSNTINGSGLDAKFIETSRFLFQAGWGGSQDEILSLAETMDFEGWIDQQMAMSPTLLTPVLWATNTRARQLQFRENPSQEFFGPFSLHFQYAWWDNNYKAPDVLRQRMAYALSQIAVISIDSGLDAYGEGLSSFYDILVRNALGNYKDILMEISYDPNMAFYLSHLNNPKTNEELGTRPDENYAREIMQLFSIGLYELNLDGSRRVDAAGNWIATYDNSDIQELAKVFTGLKGQAWSHQALEGGYVTEEMPIPFGAEIAAISRELPLQMDEDYHESGPKNIIGDFVIPAGQTGDEDIALAVDHIFNHPNVGPFISLRLIQQYVKSNPTPGYVERVARVFNDNGSGERGDLAAVLKALLLDDEARSCDAMVEPTHGKLTEPILRNTQLLHSLPVVRPDGYFWNNGFDFFNDTRQAVLAAPSVFNFYQPDHQPQGDFVEQDLVAPEYKIHDSQTAIGYMNQAHKWTQWQVMFWDWFEITPTSCNGCADVSSNLIAFRGLAEDTESLINYFDVMLTHGRLSDSTRDIIRSSLSEMNPDWDDYLVRKVQMAVYIILISPDYVVLK